MVRHSPAEKYIEFLVSHPDGYSDDTIIEMLQLKQLDFIGPSYLRRLRGNIRIPKKFTPDNKFHKPSARFLNSYRLYYLYHPDEAMKGAERVLEDPRGKETLETMLISRDSESLCAHRLSTNGHKVLPAAIERYKFFFFNIDLVDSTELRALLLMRHDFTPMTMDKYEDQMRLAMTKSGYQDPRRALAANPIPQVASMMNQIRMGFMPSRADLARMVELTRTASTVRGLSTALSMQGRNAAVETRDWALATKLFGEILADVGSPDGDIQRELQLLALRTSSSEVPHISELSGGEHTVDMQPVEFLEGPVDE